MKEAKLLRSQLRQLMPEALTSELVLAVEKRLVALITKRLDAMESRHKDVLGLMIRQAAKRPNQQ